MTTKELVLEHCQKSAEHHSAIAKSEKKIAKAHGDIAEGHTNQILAQGHRDLADHHTARAQHHQAHAKHFLEVHQHVGGIAPELFDEHSDAGDELMATSGSSMMKRLISRESA